MRKLAYLILIICAFSGAAQAQCTGSGLSFACPAGSTPTQVNAAITSAANGAVITFANGSYTWGSGNIIALNNTKGVTLICAATCNVSSSGVVLGLPQYASGTNTNFYRISGFTFNYTGNSFLIWFAYSGSCGTSGSPCTMTQVRIDHNTVNDTNASGGMVFIAFADQMSVIYTFGVADHNVINSLASDQLFLEIGNQNNSPASSALGTGNNFFLENNAINTTTLTNAGLSCVDGWGSSRTVVRYNTYTNCLMAQHGTTHAGGPDNFEFYNNTAIFNAGSVGAMEADCYRAVHHQGSNEMIYFNNSFSCYSGKNGEIISVLNYRDYGPPPSPNGSIDGAIHYADGFQGIDVNRSPNASNFGYPTWRQPGRDPATGNYMPVYSWNNFFADTLAIVPFDAPDGGYGTPDYYAQHMKANREWFDAVSNQAQTSSSSPFNGTTGMGFGTFARRPTTCTTSSETAFGAGAAGVGYFATDTQVLYTCSATNTWTVYYTPYTYPHPLVGGTPPPTIAFSPSSLNFGTVATGGSPVCPTQCLSVIVSNSSASPLNITLPYNTSDPTQFIIVSNGCATGGGVVGAGGSCTDVIQFIPTTAGTKNATITFVSNAMSSPDTYSMTGVGSSSVPPSPATGISIFVAKNEEKQ